MAVQASLNTLGGQYMRQQRPLIRLRAGQPTGQFWRRSQMSTSCSLAPFILAALPPVDLGWTFNPSSDACYVGSSYCTITPYHTTLQTNKQNIGMAIDRVLANDANDKKESYKALMLAVAMQESKFMDHRDNSKDWDPKSMNCSVLNVNCDLLERAGQLQGLSGVVDCNSIRDQNLDAVLSLLRTFFDRWGPKRSIDFIRGGSTGFDDGYGGNCDCPRYRRAITSLYQAFSDDESLMTDGRRAEIYVPGC